MSFRSLRESKHLSQEQLAEMSRLSLRTVQRVEAGHRVSFASLRALAAALEVDVDSLEREIYTLNKSTDEFVEIPRWVRLLNGEGWFNGPSPSRREAHALEALLAGCAILLFTLSLLVTSDLLVTLFRGGALFELVCCYLMSVASRIVDTYKLWPSAEGAPPGLLRIR
jgi:transcriptional regulator with XRE-family HTH domain